MPSSTGLPIFIVVFGEAAVPRYPPKTIEPTKAQYSGHTIGVQPIKNFLHNLNFYVQQSNPLFSSTLSQFVQRTSRPSQLTAAGITL
jgi:hypothetical protein